MIKDAVSRLITELGEIGLEQRVHAETALRLAEIVDGTAEEGAPPLYALPNYARELRNTLAALSGTQAPGRGLSDEELGAILRGEL